MEKSLEVRSEDHGTMCILHVGGKFTAASAYLMRNEAGGAVKRGMRTLVVDLANVSLMDSGGIGFLTNLYKELNTKGGKLCLSSIPPRIEKVLNTCGLLRVVQVYESPADAVDPSRVRKRIKTEERGFYALVNVPARFDLETLVPMREALDGLEKSGYTWIVFSFENTTFVSSVGIGVLMNVHKRLKEKKGEVYLVALSEQVRKLLDVSGVTKVLTVFEGLEQVEEKLMSRL